MIDRQRALLGSEHLDQPAPHRVAEVLANTSAMLERARATGASVVFVRHVEDEYPPMSPGHPSFEVHDAIAPLPGEPVVDKRACDAFDTPLAGLNVTLAADAHSTWDAKSGLTAVQIIAHHNATLAGIPHLTATITVTPSAEIAFAKAD